MMFGETTIFERMEMVDVQPFPVSKDLVRHPIDSQPFVSMDGHQVPGMYCIFFGNIKQYVYCVERLVRVLIAKLQFCTLRHITANVLSYDVCQCKLIRLRV